MKLSLRSALAALALLLLGGAVGGVLYLASDSQPPDSAATLLVPYTEYAEVEVPFRHRFAGLDEALPFLGSALIDVDADGWEEVFLGGGRGQPDAMLRFEGTSFEPVEGAFVPGKELQDISYGALAIDATRDGRVDLFVLRESGVWLHEWTETGFEARRLEIEVDPQTQALSLAAADLNHDGWIDLFLAGYLRPEFVERLTLFNREGYGGRSTLWMNEGGNRFRDSTAEAGLETVHNTFQAVFADLDDDADLDLVVAQDTGKVLTYENSGGRAARGPKAPRFEAFENPSSDSFAYPMGIGLGDIDGDLRPDLFFSNIGSTLPEITGRGDLREDQILHREWMLWRNLGERRFEDVARSAAVSDYEFSWGAVIEDLNLDTRQDLVVSENFVGYLPHRLVKLPGRLLIQNDDGRFAPAGDVSGATNPSYGLSPLAVDLNGDGYVDLVHVNLAGPSRAHLSLGGLENHFLQIGVPASPRWVGARVEVETVEGRRFVRWFVPTEGLASSQSRVLTFGLGSSRGVDRVRVRLASGEEGSLRSPPIDARTELSSSIFRAGGGRVRKP